jgi:hypothetical protein
MRGSTQIDLAWPTIRVSRACGSAQITLCGHGRDTGRKKGVSPNRPLDGLDIRSGPRCLIADQLTDLLWSLAPGAIAAWGVVSGRDLDLVGWCDANQPACLWPRPRSLRWR